MFGRKFYFGAETGDHWKPEKEKVQELNNVLESVVNVETPVQSDGH